MVHCKGDISHLEGQGPKGNVRPRSHVKIVTAITLSGLKDFNHIISTTVSDYILKVMGSRSRFLLRRSYI